MRWKMFYNERTDQTYWKIKEKKTSFDWVEGDV